jgi:hypothetical protein
VSAAYQSHSWAKFDAPVFFNTLSQKQTQAAAQRQPQFGTLPHDELATVIAVERLIQSCQLRSNSLTSFYIGGAG